MALEAKWFTEEIRPLYSALKSRNTLRHSTSAYLYIFKCCSRVRRIIKINSYILVGFFTGRKMDCYNILLFCVFMSRLVRFLFKRTHMKSSINLTRKLYLADLFCRFCCMLENLCPSVDKAKFVLAISIPDPSSETPDCEKDLL